ncbi:hypothetical protein LXL04_015000 [Taraxacum kok-saghyz]
MGETSDQGRKVRRELVEERLEKPFPWKKSTKETKEDGKETKEEDLLLFTLERNGDRNEMTSAKTFSYVNRCRHKWQSIPQSRFHSIALSIFVGCQHITVVVIPELYFEVTTDIVYAYRAS